MAKVIVEISARHVHLSRADLDTLFGEGYELTNKRELSQPGQYIEEERVALIGPKGSFPSIGILGPVRPATQIEVSMTDARVLGISAPVRESGDTKGSAGVKMIGPKGEIDLEEGLIVAKRHLHLAPQEALEAGVADKEIVGVKISGTGRELIFNDVVVRVSESFVSRMHIDTDEANAAGMTGEMEGEIIRL